MNLAEFIDGRRDQHLAELSEFLRIPSVSAKSEHKPDIERGCELGCRQSPRRRIQKN